MDEAEPQKAENDDHSAAQNQEPARPSLRAGILLLASGFLIGFAAQFFAQDFDYQNANIISVIAIGVSGIGFLSILHRRHTASGGSRWTLPACCVLALMIFAICFRFEGFSGEMSPQFKWRYASTTREWKTDVATDVATAKSDVPDPGLESSPSADQFLGNNRNGVESNRSFRIPGSSEEVERMWDIGVGKGWSSFAVSQGLAITLEQREDEECLTCYRLTDGELVWIKQHKGLHSNLMGGVGPRSTPTILGDKVYASSATGHLWCVDRASGKEFWTADLFELAGWNQTEFEVAAPWGYSCSPLIVDGFCVVTLGGPPGGNQSASLIALDADTGDVVWKSGDDQLSYASPIVAELGGVRQIVSVNEKTVSGHAIENGALLWTFDWPGSTSTSANCATAVMAGENSLLLGKGYGGGSALVGITSAGNDWLIEDVWRSHRLLQTKFNHTCVKDGIGFGISNGALQAVDLSEERRLWLQPRRSRAGQGQVLLCDDTLVLQDEGGDVVFVAAETEAYRELFRLHALDSKTWNIPTVAGRYLLVRNDRQAICFRLPAKQ